MSLDSPVRSPLAAAPPAVGTPRRAAPCAAMVATVLAAALLLGGCGRPAGNSLFPLDAGHRWTYSVKTERENGTDDRQQLVMRSLGERDYEDKPAFLRRSEDGIDYWLRQDETGIYRVASKTDLQAEPTRDEAPRYVLKQPLEVGTQWQASTTAYLLSRRQDFPHEIRYSHPSLPMLYRIAALDEALDTPAGRFEGCVRVEGDATVRLFADPVNGWRDLPLRTTEWYCPGVGLAKLTRQETANSTFIEGGTLTMDLIEWE